MAPQPRIDRGELEPAALQEPHEGRVSLDIVDLEVVTVHPQAHVHHGECGTLVPVEARLAAWVVLDRTLFGAALTSY